MTRNKNIRKIVGANISTLRKELGFSQEQFAEKIAMSASSLSDIENGKTYPRIENLTKITKLLNVEHYQLFLDSGIVPDFEIREDSLKILTGLIEANKDNPLYIEAMCKYAELLIAYKK